MSDLSWLNPTPHAIAVYASRPLSPVATQHSLPSGRYSLLGPDFHRLDRASFAWRTHSITSSARPISGSGTIEAEGLGGLEVDDQFHLGGLLDRQIGGFFAFENTAGIYASLSICTQGAARVAHQTASCREGACLRDRGHPVAKRQRGELFLMCNEENIARYYKPADPLLD